MEKLNMFDLTVILQTLRETLHIHGLHSYTAKKREEVANKVATVMDSIKIEVEK